MPQELKPSNNFNETAKGLNNGQLSCGNRSSILGLNVHLPPDDTNGKTRE